MNKVFLIGNVTRDPEQRTTQNGLTVCTFTLAVSRKMERDKTDFIPIVAWRNLGENSAKYLRKGSKAAVSGTLQIRAYEKDGQKRYATEVVADDVEFLTKAEGADAGLIPVDEEVPF